MLGLPTAMASIREAQLLRNECNTEPWKIGPAQLVAQFGGKMAQYPFAVKLLKGIPYSRRQRDSLYRARGCMVPGFLYFQAKPHVISPLRPVVFALGSWKSKLPLFPWRTNTGNKTRLVPAFSAPAPHPEDMDDRPNPFLLLVKHKIFDLGIK